MGMGLAMASQKTNSETLKLDLLHVMNQPTRRKVLEILSKSKGPLYIKEIAIEIRASERNTSFHLLKLAEKELVDGEFKPIDSEGGRAGKFYTLNPKRRPLVERVLSV